MAEKGGGREYFGSACFAVGLKFCFSSSFSVCFFFPPSRRKRIWRRVVENSGEALLVLATGNINSHVACSWQQGWK